MLWNSQVYQLAHRRTPRVIVVEMPRHELCRGRRVSLTSLRAPYEWYMISDVHSYSSMSLGLPTQSSDSPATQEGEHAQSVHDAATGLLIPIRGVCCSHSDVLDTCEHGSISRRYILTVYTTQDIPYNTVSIHIPIMDILPMGGSAALMVPMSFRPMARMADADTSI